MSDDSTPEENEAPGLQRVSAVRSWRQRYDGPDGDYIYRRAIRVRGTDGKLRRVQGGERVNREADGLSPRRMKALWYSESIELANAGDVGKRPGKKVITDNRAIRLEEERVRKAEDAKLEKQRLLRRELNLRQREEAAQRRLAEQAVQAAEDSERRGIEEQLAAEQRAKQAAKVDEILAERAAEAAEEAAIEKELAEEEAKLQAERAGIARERQEQAEREAGEARAIKQRESDERIAQRQAEHDEKVTDNSTIDPSPPVNPNNQTISNAEAKAALDGE